MKINFKKIGITFFLVFFSIPINAIPVKAISVSNMPDSGDMMADAEKQYGFDKNVLRRSKVKEDAPTADVYFDKSAPVDGELVTATSFGLKFKNMLEDHYYTWYLIREEDKDDDGDYFDDVIEIGKRRAMGMIARGNFDPELFDIDYDTSYADDEDGYHAPVGGADGVGAKEPPYENSGIGTYEKDNLQDNERMIVNGNKITRCYRHNFGDKEGGGGLGALNSGKNLVVSCNHKFAKFVEEEGEQVYTYNSGEEYKCSDFKVGDGEFDEEEEFCWQLNPTIPDTDGDGVPDEADLAGLGQNQFSWNYKQGDRIGVIIEGTSMSAINEGQSDITIHNLASSPVEWVEANNDRVLGGGYIEPGVVDAVRDYFLSEDSERDPQEALDIIDEYGHDPVTLGHKGGVMDTQEFVDFYKEGYTLQNERERIDCLTDPYAFMLDECQKYVNRPPFPPIYIDVTNDLTFVGYIDVDKLKPAIEDHFMLNEFELKDAIEGLAPGVQDDIAFYLDPENPETALDCGCGGDLPAWPINRAYIDGTLTQESLNEMLTGDPDYETVLLEDLMPFLDEGMNIGAEGEAPVAFTKEMLQAIFDDAIALDDEDELITEDVFTTVITDYYMQSDLTTGYYKIMWAGLDICGGRDEELMPNDECDDVDFKKSIQELGHTYDDGELDYDTGNNTHVGFTYLATVPVFEEGVVTLETDLYVSPDNPMFIGSSGGVDKELNYSDEILITSAFKKEVADPRFTYYEWSIYQCDGNDYDGCISPANKLTTGCSKGETLESCATGFESTSLVKGMGIDQISFKPTGALGIGSKGYFKVALKTKKKESLNEMAVSYAILEISGNETEILFYNIEDSGPGPLFPTSVDEICDGILDENYKMICPVHPYQVLKAVANTGACDLDPDCEINGYFWELDGKKVEPPTQTGGVCHFSDGCSDPSTAYLPIMKSFSGLKDVSLTVQKEKNGVTSNLVTTRKISVREPSAEIISADEDTVYNSISSANGEINYKAFFTNPAPGNEVKFSADVIPAYLDADSNITFDWSISNQEVDEDFMANNTTLDVQIGAPTLDSNQISFYIKDIFGGNVDDEGLRFEGTGLSAVITKKLSEAYIEMLKDSWEIVLEDEKVVESSNTVTIERDPVVLGASTTGSIDIFLASTVKNAPEYILLFLKLSVIMVLVWSALFGSSIFIESYQKENY